MEVQSLIVYPGMPEPVLMIHTNGTIEIGKGYSPTEAGEAFIEALKNMGVFVMRVKPEADDGNPT